MSVGGCMRYALEIANTPQQSWGAQLERIPDRCPTPDSCGQPHNCRERNAEYLRMQWRMKSARDRGKAGRA